jgi:hypothetical protein
MIVKEGDIAEYKGKNQCYVFLGERRKDKDMESKST